MGQGFLSQIKIRTVTSSIHFFYFNLNENKKKEASQIKFSPSCNYYRSISKFSLGASMKVQLRAKKIKKCLKKMKKSAKGKWNYVRLTDG